jgi:hypothetical protein
MSWEPDFSISMEIPGLPGEPGEPTPEPDVIEPFEPEAPDEPFEPEVPTEPLRPVPPPDSEPEPEPAAGTKAKSEPKRDTAALVAAVHKRLVDGDSDEAIAEDLSLTPAQYRRVKAKMDEQAVDGFAGKTAEMQYVDYCMEQQKCLKELDDMATHFKSTRQFNAMVGAVRAKSQILGDIHKTGVQMGVIKQEASFDREVAGKRIQELSNAELREDIAKQLAGLKGIIDRFGDKPMVEAEPSPMADPGVKRVKQ